MPEHTSIEAAPADGALRDFRPIEDYALIGDCHGAALVARDGSIDWCSFERFDAPPIFSRILDRRHGGWFEIRPWEAARVERRYLGDTNVLETTFHTEGGSIRLVDFMPVGREPSGRPIDHQSLTLPGWVVRTVQGVGGRVRLRVEYRPRYGFAEELPRLSRAAQQITADGCPTLHTHIGLEVQGHCARGTFELGAGERRSFILAPEPRGDGDIEAVADELRRCTERFWSEWSAHAAYQGKYRDAVLRSALVLKLLTYSPSGAIVAAPTTSLPEQIGGIRNWDYRFCWPRDACFALYSLAKLGYRGEAERFFAFMMRAAEERLPRLLPLYGIDGETSLDEHTVRHFEGYRGSSPVRYGNEAVEQHQLDVYGQLIDLVHLHCRLGVPVDARTARVARNIADFVAANWREPDAGLWEPRCPERRYVHSAMMAWVALDRAVQLFGERPHWCEARDAILEDLRTHGIHPRHGYLRQAFDTDATDAAVLLAPMVGLPVGDAVVEATVQRAIEELGSGPLVYRYRTGDGLPGEEGTFLVCAFWLVDALLALDRGEEARKRFEALLACANDVGLLPEEMAPDGTFLGNFPQGFTHLGLVHTALVLDLYEQHGVAGVRGTYADRALRTARQRRRVRPRRSAR